MKNGFVTLETHRDGPKRLKTGVTWPSSPSLRNIPKRTYKRKDIPSMHTWMFIIAIFMAMENWNQPPIQKWIEDWSNVSHPYSEWNTVEQRDVNICYSRRLYANLSVKEASHTWAQRVCMILHDSQLEATCSSCHRVICPAIKSADGQTAYSHPGLFWGSGCSWPS